MAVIRLYPRSNLTDPIIIERPCFADWLREMGGLPDGYRVYSGAVAACGRWICLIVFVALASFFGLHVKQRRCHCWLSNLVFC
mgnify:CR=1 FL=1